MKNASSEGKVMQLENSFIVQAPFYLYLRRLVNMKNDLDDEMDKESRIA